MSKVVISAVVTLAEDPSGLEGRLTALPLPFPLALPGLFLPPRLLDQAFSLQIIDLKGWSAAIVAASASGMLGSSATD